MKKTRYIALALLVILCLAPAAQAMNTPTLLVNEPAVTSVTATNATVSVPAGILSTLSAAQQAKLYFEYIQTKQVCIMIYPTPANCLPKKTTPGQMSAVLTGLTPHTGYSVSYVVDNTIACITVPCPENGLRSGTVEFTTSASNGGAGVALTRNLSYRSRGSDVTVLQNILRAQGYLSTGYFGIATFKAVKAFQKNYIHIAPTGFVGPLTRAALNALSPSYGEEYFSGTIQSVSTGCYVDGICSVTIDGKTVVTTIGRSQAILGSIKGTVNSIGDIETSKIGAHATVYAQKTTDGYTPYGNSAYYIDVQ